jgi:hypothetical protein
MGTSNFPSTVTLWTIKNYNYNTLKVKIRLSGEGDEKVTLGAGSTLTISVFRSAGSALMAYKKNNEYFLVQKVDLNDGGQSDDFNAPNQSDNKYNSCIYNGSKDSPAVINFDNNTYLTTFEDSDGIDGGPAAVFTQQVEATTLMCTLSKKPS